jgi:hypothetical protein
MNVPHNDSDPRQKTPLSRDEPESWRRSRAIRRITGGMNRGVRTLEPEGPGSATPSVSSPATLGEGRHRFAHEVPESLRNFADFSLRRFI